MKILWLMFIAFLLVVEITIIAHMVAHCTFCNWSECFALGCNVEASVVAVVVICALIFN